VRNGFDHLLLIGFKIHSPEPDFPIRNVFPDCSRQNLSDNDILAHTESATTGTYTLGLSCSKACR
jgi:hypothetical protein